MTYRILWGCSFWSLAFLCFHVYFVCARVFTCWACFVCRILCSAWHRCVRPGPWQQSDGPGALYKTGLSAAETSNQNTLMEAQVELFPGLGNFFARWKPQNSPDICLIRIPNLRREAPWDGQDICSLKLKNCGIIGWTGCFCRSRNEEAGLRDDLAFPS